MSPRWNVTVGGNVVGDTPTYIKHVDLLYSSWVEVAPLEPAEKRYLEPGMRTLIVNPANTVYVLAEPDEDVEA